MRSPMRMAPPALAEALGGGGVSGLFAKYAAAPRFGGSASGPSRGLGEHVHGGCVSCMKVACTVRECGLRSKRAGQA